MTSAWLGHWLMQEPSQSAHSGPTQNWSWGRSVNV